MLQNSRVSAFTVSELLRENQLGRVKLIKTSENDPSSCLKICSLDFICATRITLMFFAYGGYSEKVSIF